MKKVLLISPPYERLMGYSRFYYHIGLASLAAVLEKAGIDCLIYDADYDFTNEGKMLTVSERMDNQYLYAERLENKSDKIWQELLGVFEDYKPDIVGVSVLSVTLPSAMRTIELIREKNRDIPIITGGPHATLCPDELLKISNYVITNEGESVIVDIVNGEYKEGIINGKRIENLDYLPFPAIHRLYNLEQYKKRDLSIIISGRGCPNSCKFCNSSNLWKCKVTRKSVKYFIDEIKHLINNYQIKDFFIADDSFTYDQEWLDEFLKEIKPLNVSWRCFSRIDAINEIMVNKMKAAGCRHIKLGIESGSQRILKIINKKIDISQIMQASRILHECNMKWSAYFIVGFPDETKDDIEKTQNLIKEITADSITISTYMPLPKTRLGNFNVDYTKHSFHSKENNFTNKIDDKTYKKLLAETLELNKYNFNEHISEGDNKMSTEQEVFIMGNRIKDHIFISDDSRESVYSSTSYDLFARNIVDSYIFYSGIDLLNDLLKKFFDPKNIHKIENYITSETISEWNKKSIDGKEHLYLKKHIGLNLKLNPDVERKIDNSNTFEKLQKAKKYSFVIYDMGDTTNYEINSGIKFFDKFENAENIIIRTMFTNPRKCTKLVSDISEKENIIKKTILLCNVNEMRRGGFIIHKGISWEQLIIETYNAIKSINNINKFKAIIVCFNHEGCLIYQNGDIELSYFCDEIEGDFIIKNDKRAFGPIITMQAMLSVELLKKNKNHDISTAVRKGLLLMRKLILEGFEEKNGKILYPIEYIYHSSGLLNLDTSNFLSIKLEKKDINDSLKIINKSVTKKSIDEIYEKIITEGPSSIKAPYLRLGKLISFDRTEIEQLRNVQYMFKQYIDDKGITKPLSICVFGQPGSGKSFAVKQIAKSLKINQKTILEYNLSQMTEPKELFAAFHQIRDSGLKGNLPIVFFDEFDCKLGTKLGWLKYFLAPMQDGEFRESAIQHFLGRAIFVFAGGTCENTQQFIDMQKDTESKDNKLPDFLSRIKGYLDISGPNPLPCPYLDGKKPKDCWAKSNKLEENGVLNKDEKHYIMQCPNRSKYCLNKSHYMRRAILLRSMLENKLNIKEGEKINIDENVIKAFLNVELYLHGARSLEAIIQTSNISASQEFTASCIGNDFCDLYVTDDFEEYLYGNRNQHRD